MKKDNRRIVGVIGTLLVHAALIFLLFVIYIHKPNLQAESGVPVMLGNVDASQGMFDPATMTEVDVLPQELATPEEVQPQEVVEQEMITQTEEESVAIKPRNETKPKPTVEKPKPEVEKPREKTEAEKRAEAEKAAAEAAAKRISGAFGKGSQMGNTGIGTTGSGNEGSPQGNSATGKSSGVGGYGTFDLDGRSLGEGGLPRPVYNVQDEGRVVVTITVNPRGEVTNTSIIKRTNTVNAALRKADEDAARKARFNTVDGVNNQMGTITYYFKLK